MLKKIISFIGILSFLFTVSAQIPTDSLMVYYTFSGNSLDSSGNGNSGVVVQAVLAADRFGTQNSAYSFDGKDDYIWVDSAKGLPPVQNARTVAAWFLSTGNPNSTGQFVSYGAAAPLQAFMVGLNGGDLTVSSYGAGNEWKPAVSGINIQDGLWHHCAVTYNGTKTEMYVDGVLQDSTVALACSTSTDSLYVGRDLGANWQYFKGSLDEIAIYAKALTAAEVEKLYDPGDLTIKLIPIAGPTSERRPVFSWYTSPSVTLYTIKIDTTNTLASPIIITPVSDTSYTPTIDLPAGTIYWQVSGDNGLVSQISSFVIVDQNIPVLVPFDPNIIFEVRPQFKWHPVSGATSYTLDVDTSVNFISILVTTPVSDTFYTPLIDLPRASIYWRVKSNLNPSYSETGMVLIQSDSIPFLYRYNGDTVVAFRPQFKWKPVSGATVYQVQLDSTGDFAAPFLSVPLSDTLYVPSIDLWDMKLFWRVSSNRSPGVYCFKDSLIVNTITGIDPKSEKNSFTVLPITFFRDGRHTVRIIYNALTQACMQVEIYSIKGRLIRRIEQMVDQKNNSIAWKGLDKTDKLVSAGTYVVRVRVDGRQYYKMVNILY